MLPYCVDLSDFIKQLPESLFYNGCSTPPPASSSVTVFYKFVYVCMCVRVCVWESVCIYRTLRNSTEIWSAIRKLAEIWRSGNNGFRQLWVWLCSWCVLSLDAPCCWWRERERGGRRGGVAGGGERNPLSMYWPTCTKQSMHQPTAEYALAHASAHALAHATLQAWQMC